jgi:DNA invertase Pin-like site-specific DNA recombinase
MNVYGYCRVSTDHEAERGESPAAQRQRVKGKAAAMGVSLGHIYSDEGVSGSIPLGKRPEGAKLLSGLQRGDTIIVAGLDRMFRNVSDALQTIDHLQRRDVGLRFLDIAEGADVRNGVGKLMLTILTAFAEQERDKIRERVRTAKAHQRSQDRYLGGIAPFGYRVSGEKGDDGRKLTEDPGEQRIIKRARRLRAAGRTLRHIQAAIKKHYDHQISLDALARITRDIPPSVRTAQAAVVVQRVKAGAAA